MKTTDIILAQIKYLNKNIKTLFFISFPLIILLGIGSHDETIAFMEGNSLSLTFYYIIDSLF